MTASPKPIKPGNGGLLDDPLVVQIVAINELFPADRPPVTKVIMQVVE